MKTIITLIILALATVANADTIELDWSYNDGNAVFYELTEMTAYVNGEPVCTSPYNGEDHATMLCDHDFPHGELAITIDGLTRDRGRTPMSEPVVFVYQPPPPEPMVIRSLRLVIQDERGAEHIFVFPGN